MDSGVFLGNKKFLRKYFDKEEEFEGVVKNNSKTLFGSKTIYIDLKNKIKSKSLGNTIPDGFLFDFSDPDNPDFYLIEVELAKHEFWDHIFPQITKFFAFFKNPKSREELIDVLTNFIKSNESIEAEFKSYIGKKEIFKTVKDIIDNSQNILLIIDEDKPEFDEVFETYTDTWDKMVKREILNVFTHDNNTIFTLTPDFENIELVSAPYEEAKQKTYDESFHLSNVDPKILETYQLLKESMLKFDNNIIFNPQKYYISLKRKKNFAFINFSKKKLHIVVMLPYQKGKDLIKKNKLKELSEGVQRFYNGACFDVTLENKDNINEVINLLKESYEKF
jgi:predicted transport protein